MEEKEQTQGYSYSNEGFTNAGVIQLRLDTNQLLEQLESYLKGTKIIGYQEVNGAIRPIESTTGKAKMNSLGVQSVMSWLTPLLSPHTVQGNYKDVNDLQNFLCRLEIDLFSYLMINIHEFNINEYEIDGVVDMIINTAEPFFTRLLENKERESYGQSMVHRESRSAETKDGFKIFR